MPRALSTPPERHLVLDTTFSGREIIRSADCAQNDELRGRAPGNLSICGRRATVAARFQRGQLVGGFGLCSCGYLLHGKTETIEVTSDPPGAQVVVSNGQTGVTPFWMDARRDQGLTFHFTKSGYQAVDVSDESTVETKTKVGNAVALASFAAMPFSLPIVASPMVDQATGADHVHQTNLVSAHLTPLGNGAASSPAPTATQIAPGWMPPTPSE
jgi:hypothetical protein